jgi:hypothetical protein
MFLSLPVIVKLSITVYVDLGLIFFSTASLIFFLRWIEERYQLRYLILSAVFCGLALGTKYNGLIVFFLLTVFIPFIVARRKAPTGATDRQKSENKNTGIFSKALGYAGLFIFIALLIYSPWVIRNIIWTNNPVYPLYQSWFDPQERRISVNDPEDPQVSDDPDGGRTKGPLTPLPRRRLLFNESWWQVMLVPVRIFFQGQDDNPQLFDGKLNPYLLLFHLFAFIGVKKDSATVKTEKLILLVFAVLYLMLVFFKVDMRIRWVAPIIPPLVILAVFGLHKIVTFLMDKYTPVTAMLGIGATLAVLLFLLIINAIYIFGQFKIVDPWSYLSGRIDREAYIAKYRPEYTVIQYSNQHLAEDDKILGLFLGKRRYYSDREIIFAARLFRQAVINSRSANMIVSDLQESGITHLLIRFDIFKTWSETVFSVREKEILNDFFNSNISLLITKGGYGLYQLKTNPG